MAKVAHVTAGHGFSLLLRKPVNFGEPDRIIRSISINLETTRNQPQKIAVEGMALSTAAFFIAFSAADGTVWTMGRNNGQLVDEQFDLLLRSDFGCFGCG